MSHKKNARPRVWGPIVKLGEFSHTLTVTTNILNLYPSTCLTYHPSTTLPEFGVEQQLSKLHDSQGQTVTGWRMVAWSILIDVVLCNKPILWLLLRVKEGGPLKIQWMIP